MSTFSRWARERERERENESERERECVKEREGERARERKFVCAHVCKHATLCQPQKMSTFSHRHPDAISHTLTFHMFISGGHSEGDTVITPLQHHRDSIVTTLQHHCITNRSILVGILKDSSALLLPSWSRPSLAVSRPSLVLAPALHHLLNSPLLNKSFTRRPFCSPYILACLARASSVTS
jgi:hypothetical protein